MMVVFPAPEGAEKTMEKLLFCCIAIHQSICQGFRLHGREYDMIAIHHNDGPGLSTMGCVNEDTVLLCLLSETFARGRGRSDDRNDPFCHHGIAKSHIY